MGARSFAVIVLLASMAGFGFAAVSTYDSVAHLDRQVHGIHCSYLLGMGEADAAGTSGCYTTLMSPYSSVLRGRVWGGIPVALAGMSVFAFLFFWTLWMLLRGVFVPRACGFLFLATALPFMTSVVMGYLSIVDLDAVCKMCMGIYISSGAAFLAAGVAYSLSRNQPPPRERGAPGQAPSGPARPEVSWQLLFGGFGMGVLFVVVPFGAYNALAPDFSRYVGNCGTLKTSRDTDRVLVPYGPQDREVEMIEVLDPLCAACGMLERRVDTMSEMAEVNRRLLLFPLDNACNWMVDEAIHPGACAVSDAVLCAGKEADAVLDWSLTHQAEILERAGRDPEAAGRMVTRQFPFLKQCVGGAAVRARLNLALRWAVKNQLQVLTPQIFVQGLRLCDEDTDLGLEFALPRLIDRARTAPAAREGEPPDEIPPRRPAPDRRPSRPKTTPAVKPGGREIIEEGLEKVKSRIDEIAPPAEGTEAPVEATHERDDSNSKASLEAPTNDAPPEAAAPPEPLASPLRDQAAAADNGEGAP